MAEWGNVMPSPHLAALGSMQEATLTLSQGGGASQLGWTKMADVDQSRSG